MIKNQRQKSLLDLLEFNEIMSISDLSERLNSSMMTIRRDLEYLDQKGIIKKVHGGAILIKNEVNQSSFHERIDECSTEKIKIGKEAAKLIKQNSIVFFDAGTTPLAVVEHIPDDLEFTAITTGLMTAIALCNKPYIHVINIGGNIHCSSYSSTNHISVEIIKKFNADLAFISTKAVLLPQGTFESYLPLIEVKQALVSVSNYIVLLADHNKFETKSLCLSIPMEKINMTITDSQTPKPIIEKMKEMGIKVIVGKAMLNEPGIVEIACMDKNVNAKNIIIATGSKVFIPPIKGVEGRNIIDSTSALSMKKVPSSLTVIGGGIIGLEFATIYSTLGTNTTVIEMLPEIVANEDREVVTALRNELEKRDIKIVTGAKVQEISDGKDTKIITYVKDGETLHCVSEFVLAASGRRPNIDGINMEKLGLELDDKGNIKVNKKMETNIPGIYAVGDVIGGYQLAHSAYAEAEVAAENCMGGNVLVDLDNMPRCIYSIPQLASVGLTEEQAKERGIHYKKGIFPYTANGKAMVSDEVVGLVKVLVHRETGKLIGVHIVGGNATELISSAVTAMNFDAGVDDFYSMILPHPTLSEMLKESVLYADNMAVHLPKR